MPALIPAPLISVSCVCMALRTSRALVRKRSGLQAMLGPLHAARKYAAVNDMQDVRGTGRMLLHQQHRSIHTHWAFTPTQTLHHASPYSGSLSLLLTSLSSADAGEGELDPMRMFVHAWGSEANIRG